MSARTRASWALAAAGLGLAVALVLLAQPRNIVRLALHARPGLLLLALAGTAVVHSLRGLRLSLLAGTGLGVPRAASVAAITQLATGVLPMRIGELALVPLLQAVGVAGTIRALALLLLARLLDMGAVLVWGIAAAAVLGGDPSLALVGFLVLLAAVVAAGTVGARGLLVLARRWRARAGWRRHALRRLLRGRREIALVTRSPVRAGGGAAVSLAIWAGIWGVTVVLLRAMGLPWGAGAVLLGVVGGAIGSSIPVNSVGSFGTQEAGWTAGLASAGVPARQALAAGFACHLWVIVFSVVVGAVAAVYLLAVHPGRPASTLLASVKSFLASARRA